MMERVRECAECMDVKISKTRLSELRRKADLAQSLADALDNVLADFKAHTQWQGEELNTISNARAALKRYRGE